MRQKRWKKTNSSPSGISWLRARTLSIPFEEDEDGKSLSFMKMNANFPYLAGSDLSPQSSSVISRREAKQRAWAKDKRRQWSQQNRRINRSKTQFYGDERGKSLNARSEGIEIKKVFSAAHRPPRAFSMRMAGRSIIEMETRGSIHLNKKFIKNIYLYGAIKRWNWDFVRVWREPNGCNLNIFKLLLPHPRVEDEIGGFGLRWILLVNFCASQLLVR